MTIDLIATTSPDLFANSTVLDDTLLLSDHYAVSASLIPPTLPPSNHPKPRLVWMFSKANYEGYRNYLNHALSNWEESVFSPLTSARAPAPPPDVSMFEAWRATSHPGDPQPAILSPQSSVDSLCSSLTETITHAAEKFVSRKKAKHNRPVWWFTDPSVEEELVNLRVANRAWKKLRKNPARKDAAAKNFSNARKVFRKSCRDAQEKYWSEFTNKISDTTEGKIKIAWNILSKSKGSSKTNLCCVKDSHDNLPKDHASAVENMAKHIASTCTPFPSAAFNAAEHLNISSTVSNLHHNPRPCTVADPNTDWMTNPINVKEVLDLKTSLTKGSAPGPDDIPPELIKNGPDSLFKALSLLFNYCWLNGVLPSTWKQAHVITIFKGGDKSQAGNYRPISLTSVLAKLFEKVVSQRLCSYLGRNNFISPNQAGFRTNFSTMDHLFRLHEAILETFRKSSHKASSSNYKCVAFLDISKAFDSTWIDGLLYKIWTKYKITGHAFSFLKAFLTDRAFKIVDKGACSSWHKLLAGVPQGCVLSPTLFLLFINDLCDNIAGHICLFADDISLWPKQLGENGDRVLRKDLETIHKWSLSWRVNFGADKSKFVCFSRSRAQWDIRDFELGPIAIQRAPYYKYLGITFQEDGHFTEHFHRVADRASRAANYVTRIITKADNPTMPVIRRLILATVVPIITYGAGIWTPKTRRQWAKLNAIIARPLTKVLGLPKSAHTEAILFESGIHNLTTIWHAYTISVAHRLSNRPHPHPTRALYASLPPAASSKSKASLPYSLHASCEDIAFRYDSKTL